MHFWIIYVVGCIILLFHWTFTDALALLILLFELIFAFTLFNLFVVTILWALAPWWVLFIKVLKNLLKLRIFTFQKMRSHTSFPNVVKFVLLVMTFFFALLSVVYFLFTENFRASLFFFYLGKFNHSPVLFTSVVLGILNYYKSC